MSEKVKVEVCVGTTCFILGSSELQDIERYIPAEFADKVEVVGCPCLGMCKQSNYGHAPFVRIGEEKIVSNATVDNVVEAVKEFFAERCANN